MTFQYFLRNAIQLVTSIHSTRYLALGDYMFKNIFYRSCALVSELEDTLRHLYQWHRSWSTPPRDRVLDMYALEDRVLFSIAPIVKAAALQAGTVGTGAATAQNPQAGAIPAPDQTLLAVHRGHAGQDTRQAFDVSLARTTSRPPLLGPIYGHGTMPTIRMRQTINGMLISQSSTTACKTWINLYARWIRNPRFCCTII